MYNLKLLRPSCKKELIFFLLYPIKNNCFNSFLEFSATVTPTLAAEKLKIKPTAKNYFQIFSRTKV